MKIDPNAPAFPVSDTVHANGQVEYGANGLTVRAHFAAMAMQGMLARPSSRNEDWESCAIAAVGRADALIFELNKEAEPAKCQHDWQPAATTEHPSGTICSKCGERAPF